MYEKIRSRRSVPAIYEDRLNVIWEYYKQTEAS